MTVDNISVPASVTTPELEVRRVVAMEVHAEATRRSVELQAEIAAPYAGDPKLDRFERFLYACVLGKVATDVEGFLRFARELCDGVEREFPSPEAAP